MKKKKLKGLILVETKTAKEIIADINKTKIITLRRAEMKHSCRPCWRGCDEELLGGIR